MCHDSAHACLSILRCQLPRQHDATHPGIAWVRFSELAGWGGRPLPSFPRKLVMRAGTQWEMRKRKPPAADICLPRPPETTLLAKNLPAGRILVSFPAPVPGSCANSAWGGLLGGGSPPLAALPVRAELGPDGSICGACAREGVFVLSHTQQPWECVWETVHKKKKAKTCCGGRASSCLCVPG